VKIESLSEEGTDEETSARLLQCPFLYQLANRLRVFHYLLPISINKSILRSRTELKGNKSFFKSEVGTFYVL